MVESMVLTMTVSFILNLNVVRDNRGLPIAHVVRDNELLEKAAMCDTNVDDAFVKEMNIQTPCGRMRHSGDLAMLVFDESPIFREKKIGVAVNKCGDKYLVFVRKH
jgi:hypothetical protein